MARPVPKVVIRRPEPSEADAIAGVHNRAWREAYAHLLPESFYDDAALAQRRAMWRHILAQADRSARLRVADVADSVVGVAFAGPSRDEDPAVGLELYLIYVLASHYGTGAGQRLLDAVVGAEPTQLWVAKDNPRAHAFYRRNGFAPDGAEKIDARANDLVEVRLVRR